MLKKTFKASEDMYPNMISFVREFLQNTNLDNRKRKNLELALEEALLNIIHYAYVDTDGDLEIQAFSEKEGQVVTFLVTDSGVVFNPFKCEERKLPTSLENEEPGSLGIFLIKKMCDEYEYEYKDNLNMIRLSKHV